MKEKNDLIIEENTRVDNESVYLTEGERISICNKGESTSYASFHVLPSSSTILVVNLDHSAYCSLSLVLKTTGSSFNAAWIDKRTIKLKMW